jgi:hypothetical protein
MSNSSTFCSLTSGDGYNLTSIAFTKMHLLRLQHSTLCPSRMTCAQFSADADATFWQVFFSSRGDQMAMAHISICEVSTLTEKMIVSDHGTEVISNSLLGCTKNHGANGTTCIQRADAECMRDELLNEKLFFFDLDEAPRMIAPGSRTTTWRGAVLARL